MPTDVTLPQLGSAMLDAKIVAWLKQEGDAVRQGEPIVEVETDKVTAELDAPAAGVLGPILAQADQIVLVGAKIGTILAPGEEPALHSPATGDKSDDRIKASPSARRVAAELGVDLIQVTSAGAGRIVEADVRRYAQQHAQRQRSDAERVNASPIARRLAQEHGIDLAGIQGSGPGDRVVKEDVEAAIAAQPSPNPQPTTPAAAVEPLQGIRRIVAQRMTESFASAPHFYLTAEVDATALQRIRDGLIDKVEATASVRLTITDILIKICARALAAFPDANSTWTEQDGGGRAYQAEINVGIATAVDDGLVVPVIHGADRCTLGEIAARRADLVEARARAGRLALPDLEGGTFTLSNLGMFRVDYFQAIINPPQSMILAVGRIGDRPLAVDGEVVARPTLFLTLSVDHRLLDGVQAARFLERLAQLVEEPYLLLD